MISINEILGLFLVFAGLLVIYEALQLPKKEEQMIVDALEKELSEAVKDIRKKANSGDKF